MDIKTVEKPEMRVVGLRHEGAYMGIGKAFEELHKSHSHLEAVGKGLVAIYYDDPHSVPEADLRSMAGVIVDNNVEAPDLAEEEIPAGKYAVTTISGDYSNLPTGWEQFYGEIMGSGLKTKPDLCYEQYLNTPGDVPPDQLKTELYAPLA